MSTLVHSALRAVSPVLDVTTDQLPSTGRLAMQELTPQEVISMAEELLAYHQHFAPLSSRRERRKWDDEPLLAEHQRLVNETLAEEDGGADRRWLGIS